MTSTQILLLKITVDIANYNKNTIYLLITAYLTLLRTWLLNYYKLLIL